MVEDIGAVTVMDTIFSPDANWHRFTLIMEQGSSENVKIPKSSLNKRLSLLRYPGGKARLRITFIRRLTLLNPKGLSALMQAVALLN